MSSFSSVPRTGVIYVMEKAAKLGFQPGARDWFNLGQGAPETGPLPGSPQRLSSIAVDTESSEYAPVGGLLRLREAVAALYNDRYRQGKASQYTAENVAISSGGRAGLTRIAAALDRVNLGHFLPDYTAYEELLGLFRDFVSIPIVNANGRLADGARLREEIVGRGLGALLLSNPCNPTGDVLYGEALADWIRLARESRCAMIFDEFYSHYLYSTAASGRTSNSACEFIEDVNHDPVLIVDGLTKNWRYPGLRISWTLGPVTAIQAICSAGSFLDGGAPHPVQDVAVQLVDRQTADAEAAAIQSVFASKRRLMIDRIREMGLELEFEPLGGFYCFPSLKNLRQELRNGMDFFEAALEKHVICVPGKFFDVNPGHRRRHIPSRLRNYVRLSFGPTIEELSGGLDRLAELIGDG